MNSSLAKSRRRIAPVIAATVAVALTGLFWVLIRGAPMEADSAYSPLIGKPAPSVHATTITGTSFNLEHRKGSWVILNFFNATCAPCVREHVELVKFMDQQRALGVFGAEFYTVVWDDRDGTTSQFFARDPVAWPVVLDPDANIAVQFGVAKVPETWIIDPDGVVAERIIGGLTHEGLTQRLDAEQSTFESGKNR